MLLLEPGRDLLAIRLQSIGLRRCPRAWSADHPTRLDELHHLLLARRRSVGGHSELLGGAQVLLHRLARHATGAGDRALRLAHLPAPNDFDHLHATQLPIAHPAHLVVADMVMNRAAGGLILREDHPGLMLRDETCPHWPNRHDERQWVTRRPRFRARAGLKESSFDVWRHESFVVWHSTQRGWGSLDLALDPGTSLSPLMCPRSSSINTRASTEIEGSPETCAPEITRGWQEASASFGSWSLATSEATPTD